MLAVARSAEGRRVSIEDHHARVLLWEALAALPAGCSLVFAYGPHRGGVNGQREIAIAQTDDNGGSKIVLRIKGASWEEAARRLATQLAATAIRDLGES